MSYFSEELQELLPSVDPFFPFGYASSADSTDIFLPVTEFHAQNAVEETDARSALFLEGTEIDFRHSSSPPCRRLEDLTLYQSDWSYPIVAQPNYDCLGSVKQEKSETSRAFISRSYDGCDDFNKYMTQRNGFLDETQETNNVLTFSGGWIDSQRNSFFGGQIRRACSTGDLQFPRSARERGSSPRSFSSLPAGERSIHVGEQHAKAVRCSAEERKEKILKYRAKRAQRNFNKTIKYACRKTLADTRARIRGRFARNDESGYDPREAAFHSNNNDEEEDGHWVGNGMMREDQEVVYGAGDEEGGGEETYVTSYAQGQLRYNYYNY